MHFGSIQMNFAWIHVSYFSNFQNKLMCIDTYDLVSIHSSSVWTERYLCIDTWLHASIHASKRLTCIDTNINMYRYKTRETVLYDNFSFIHASNHHKLLLLQHEHSQNPQFPILYLPQNLTKTSNI